MEEEMRAFNQEPFLLFCILLLPAIAGANPIKPFRAGNSAYADGRFGDAVHAYMEAASQAPATAEVFYNLGNAQYRMNAFAEAAASFDYAASLAGADSMRSRCWYNQGNCMVKSGEQLHETDPQAAVIHYRQAAWFYRRALDHNIDLEDAAYNLEITQRMAFNIEEEIREQEKKEQQQNELIRYIREKLQELITRQGHLLNESNTGKPQQMLEKETRELAEVMESSGLHADIALPDGTAMPGPLKETFEHTLKAAEAMAVPDQITALAELVAALGAAPEEPRQQTDEPDEDSDDYEDYDMQFEESSGDEDTYEEADPFGDFSEYEEIRGVPPPNQTEMDILAEELRNQERRKTKKSGDYKAVEKDW
jgi:tetratricopeptide (TPR) repeat protein